MATTNTHTTDNRGSELEGIAITFLVLAVVSFALRAHVRAYMMKAFGLDDWFMSAAAITFLAYVSCVLAGVHYGTGRRSADLAASDERRALQVSNAPPTIPFEQFHWFSCQES